MPHRHANHPEAPLAPPSPHMSSEFSIDHPMHSNSRRVLSHLPRVRFFRAQRLRATRDPGPGLLQSIPIAPVANFFYIEQTNFSLELMSTGVGTARRATGPDCGTASVNVRFSPAQALHAPARASRGTTAPGSRVRTESPAEAAPAAIAVSEHGANRDLSPFGIGWLRHRRLPGIIGRPRQGLHEAICSTEVPAHGEASISLLIRNSEAKSYDNA